MKKGYSLLLLICLLASAPAFPAAAEVTPLPAFSFTRRDIPRNEAMDFMKKIGLGWNLGNTFDAIREEKNAPANEMDLETAWSHAKTTETMIDALQSAGFTAIRIPVSWHDHVSGPDYQISEAWLSRVQQVVDWVYSRGMTVILNIHHDEEQFLPDKAHLEASAHFIECLWRQLAERFRDYDQRLILESMNEPRLLGTVYEWRFSPFSPACQEAAECINLLNQLFVDTVRAAGGYNADRYLMIPAYDANPMNAARSSFRLPQDTADNKIIVSVHAYTPYDFSLNIKGGGEFHPNNESQTREIESFMDILYDAFVARGTPVVIGEFGALKKKDNLPSRVEWTAYYTANASARNIPVFWWDNSAFSGSGELFGLLDRKTLSFPQPEIVAALMRYGLKVSGE